MGTGILALPFAFHLAGFAMGCVLCVGGAAFCALSLHMLVVCGRRIDGPVTFASLCEAALPGSGMVMDVAVIANCLGTSISYLIVAADCFSALGIPRTVCVLASTAMITPASFFRSLDTLKASSAVAIGCLIGIVVMVVVFGFDVSASLDPCPEEDEHNHCGSSVELVAPPLSEFCSLPYFVMAYACQQNAYNAIGELKRPTKARQLTVVVCAPMLPMLLYLTIAISGYLTFGENVPSNIINAYPHEPLVSFARAVLGIVVLCNFPLQLFPSRVSALSIIELRMFSNVCRSA